MQTRRGIYTTPRYGSAGSNGSGQGAMDAVDDPTFPTGAFGLPAPGYWFDAAAMDKWRDGEPLDFFPNVVTDPANSAYDEIVAGPTKPKLIRSRPNSNGKSVITFGDLLYYQYDVTGMTAAAGQYHAQGTSCQLQDSAYVFVAGDVLVYEVYWPSSDGTYNASGPPYMALDLFGNSPQEQFTGLSVNDQNGLHATTGNLSAYATDAWYQRFIAIPSTWIGDPLLGIDVRCEADTGGSFRARFRNAHVLKPDGTKVWIAQGASWRSNSFFSRSGASSAGSFPASTPDTQYGYFQRASDFSVAWAQPNTYLAVAYGYPNNDPGRNVLDGESSRNVLYWSASDSKWRMYGGSTEVAGTTVESEPMAAPVATAALLNGASSKLWRAGVVESSGVSPGTSALDRIRIGTFNLSATGAWSDWIGELICYDIGLTDSQVDAIGAYLRDKWGVPWQSSVPTFVAASALAASTSSPTTVSSPTGTEQSGDVAILAVWTNASNTFSTPTDWTPISGAAAESDANMSFKLFWRRCTGNLPDTSISTSGGTALGTTNGLFGRAYIVRGCRLTGDPFEYVDVNGPTTTNTPTFDAIDGLGGPNRLGLVICMADDDNTWASGMPPSGWANVGTRLSTTTGGDAMIDAIAKSIGQQAGTDEAGANVGVMSAADYWATVTLALVPL